MRYRLSALAVAFALAFSPAASFAKPSKVEWSRVEVPPGDDAARLEKTFKAALVQAAKKASFGDAKSVVLTAKLVELTTETHGDVLRVSCTVKGRVVGGASAKSKITYGGSPNDRAELEKQVLTMVANGLVARLAQIARAQASDASR